MLKVINGKIFSFVGKTETVTQYAQIYFVISGTCRFGGDDVYQGNGFFSPAGGYVRMEASEQSEAVLALFSFDGEDTEELLDGFEKECVLSFNDAPRVNALIKALCPSDTYESLGQEADRALAKLLFSVSVRSVTSLYAPRSGKAHVDAAVKYIEDNYASDIKVEQIAQRLCVDRKYLRNLFTEHLGMSTMDYIMKTRMTRAKELLSDPSLSVTLVASSVGYRDALCFSKAFKRYVGISPSEFRETIKKQSVKKKNSVPVFIL